MYTERVAAPVEYGKVVVKVLEDKGHIHYRFQLLWFHPVIKDPHLKGMDRFSFPV